MNITRIIESIQRRLGEDDGFVVFAQALEHGMGLCVEFADGFTFSRGFYIDELNKATYPEMLADLFVAQLVLKRKETLYYQGNKNG